MKKLYSVLAAAAVAFSAAAWTTPSPLPTEMYAIGDVCNPDKCDQPANALGDGTGWNPGNALPMTKVSDGVFEITLNIKTAVWFAFNPSAGAGLSWDDWNPMRYTPAASQMVQDGPQPMTINGNPDSFSAVAGEYKFTVDANSGILTVSGAGNVEMGDLYLRGEMNNWLDDGAEDAYKFATTDDNTYTLTVESLAAGETFKIGTMDWVFQYVAENNIEDADNGSLMLTLDKAYYFIDHDPGYANAMAENQENVLITLDLEAETITFTKAAGISAIVAEENAPAVYYNLQGVRVANPENGLFIEVRGNKASKVIR